MPSMGQPCAAGDGRAREHRRPILIAFTLVAASMVVMFRVPSGDFLAAAYGSTACMAVAAYFVTDAAGSYSSLFRPSGLTLALGLLTAGLLYLVFVGGNQGIATTHPFGISTSSESSIYSLIASPGNPLYLQVGVLAFDAVGYESFFRGALQTALRSRTGLSSVFIVALVDASLHVFTRGRIWFTNSIGMKRPGSSNALELSDAMT